MRVVILSSMLLSVLTACSSYAPPMNLTGVTKDELVAKMGTPDMQRQTATGTRLEFPRGPLGHHTWFVYLDAAGHAIRSEQVLTESNFNQIAPGLSQGEVRERLGRPSDVQGLGRSRGVVWSYRYENSLCQWFQVEISQEQLVRSAGYGEPPECTKPDDIIIP
jgi:hypothetical protein